MRKSQIAGESRKVIESDGYGRSASFDTKTGTNEARVPAFERWLADVGRTHRDSRTHGASQGKPRIAN